MSATLFAADWFRVPCEIAAGATFLGGFALPLAALLHVKLVNVTRQAPFRHMRTPGGKRMAVAMTNCGDHGWISDESGYRYSAHDPLTSRPWPALPTEFGKLATAAASCAGFHGFVPDACLINRYVPGARLALHQDRDERDYSAPIVSVSLGLPAVFLFGGRSRNDRPIRVQLVHGDVVVWGGPARLRYHGIAKLADGAHPELGAVRYNLTLRKAM